VNFELRRNDLHSARFVDTQPPEPADGEAVLAIDRFGLTSNNVTYAVFGEAMNYWDFFPASEPDRGRLPVWGFADVSKSAHPGLGVGTRVYGYFPLADHLLVQPGRVNEKGFIDTSEHRKPLPSAYQGYRATDADPIYDESKEAEQILFWPLFYTSFLVDDFLADEDFFGAGTMVLSSASSKTAIIAAYLLAQREGIEIVGLTSPGNTEFVEGLKIYDKVVTYDDVGSLPTGDAVYVDFSGDGNVRQSVHGHYGDGLAHSAAIGMTHWDQMAAGAGELPGPKPEFFFAPTRIKKRGSDWGTAKLDENVCAAWTPFAEWASGWLKVVPISGEDEIKRVYLEILDGDVDPKVGHVVEMGDSES
jgi:hypothetical protein